MGCDIHTFLERKRKVRGKEEWVNVDYWKINPYFNQYGCEPKYNMIEFYGDRDYELFSILANVSNSGNNEPICQPKGLPEDCSNIVKEENKYWGGDAHSESYFTLKELMEYYNKVPTTKRSGMLSPKALIKFDKYGELPESWCKWTNISGHEFREWEVDSVLKPLIDKMKSRLAEELYIYDCYENYENEILKESDNFRIVFWFDN